MNHGSTEYPRMAESDIRRQLEEFGIANTGAVVYNGTRSRLVEEAVKRDEALLVEGGPLVAYTGSHTGRSPNDKFVVDEQSSTDHVWWGDVNRKFPREKFDALLAKAKSYL